MVEIPMVMAGAAAVPHLPPSLEAAYQAEPTWPASVWS